MTVKLLSICCNQMAIVEGGGGIGGTYYYVCTKCGKPCDTYYPNVEEKK